MGEQKSSVEDMKMNLAESNPDLVYNTEKPISCFFFLNTLAGHIDLLLTKKEKSGDDFVSFCLFVVSLYINYFESFFSFLNQML